MGLIIKHKGSFKKTESFFKKMMNPARYKRLESFGRMGVEALRAHTPRDSGVTADSWEYDVVVSGSNAKIIWSNSNVVKGVPIAIILQYGHGTGTGGYVAGKDYINPAMKTVFDHIADEFWEEVTSA